VRTWDQFLETGWYTGADLKQEVVVLPEGVGLYGLGHAGWDELRGSAPGRQPAWAWQWTLEELISRLEQFLDQRELPVLDGPLCREAAWVAALGITHHGSNSVADIDQALSRYSPRTVLLNVGRTTYRLDCLRRALADRRARGEDVLLEPWPGPDKHPDGPWPWSAYSEQQLLRRTRAVFEAALQGYDQLVTAFFPAFKLRLATAVNLPARLVGGLHLPDHASGIPGDPWLEWYLDPLRLGEKTEIEIETRQLGVLQMSYGDRTHKLRSLRPGATSSAKPIAHFQRLDLWETDPATQLVYRWVNAELRELGWTRT
jgi:hypothetical protein